MKPTMLAAILLILLGFGAEFDEYVFYKASFQISEIAHHEVIAIALWCLGIGVLIGSLLERTSKPKTIDTHTKFEKLLHTSRCLSLS